jgi:radical SAM protein with 4Fe4S-binding SPASM domain
MKETQYKTFSLKTHQKNWRINRTNVCQLELTFGCGLHCQHCYTDCYNKPRYIKNELDTRQVKYILDKVYNTGVIWLCFTGGDPLTRKDFLDLYSYAKDKGFIVTIFSNGYSMTDEIIRYFKKRPPFVLEITLNAVTPDLYEKISRVRGSFVNAMNGINLILKVNLPLKIKTQVTKENLKEITQIKKFIRGLGLKPRPSTLLHSRLDRDLVPCSLRISPEEVLSLDGKMALAGCRRPSVALSRPKMNLFNCAAGDGDGLYIDPYGNIIPCICIREPRINLLREDIQEAHKRILNWVRTKYFTYDVKCRNCPIRDRCYNCPGKAYLEKGSLEAVVDWFCKLAHLKT